MSLNEDELPRSPASLGGRGNIDSDNENASDNEAAEDSNSRSVSPDTDQNGQVTDSFPSMAAILFGNIDSDGKLTDNDFLDSESKEKLSGLSTLLGKDNEAELFEASDNIEEISDKDEPFIEGQKAEDAQDFSNMEDAMTDDSSSNDEESDEEKEPNENSGSVNSCLVTDNETKKDAMITSETNQEKKSKTESPSDSPVKQESNLDSELMPPPPGPILSSKTSPKVTEEFKEKKNKPKAGPVIKPLASMMPEKYRGVDVKTLFPEFRENQVLRFSRLFPVKQENMPKIWKNVKRRLMKSEGDSDEPKPKIKRPYTYENSFAPSPDPILHPEAYCEDQAVRFHSAKKVLFVIGYRLLRGPSFLEVTTLLI